MEQSKKGEATLGEKFVSHYPSMFTEDKKWWGKALDEHFLRWISVKEDLPKESNEVLVFNGNFITIGFYRKDFKIEDDQSVTPLPRKWEYSSVKIDWEITHWMPMPKPPIK